jgi:hypothetical protein
MKLQRAVMSTKGGIAMKLDYRGELDHLVPATKRLLCAVSLREAVQCTMLSAQVPESLLSVVGVVSVTRLRTVQLLSWRLLTH